MRFNTSDPDIATIIGRIERKTMDLQPDFQRGEVWGTQKKQRLIDSILRKWHVPPIHLVGKGGGRFDVLDGQQRLTAIRDFVRGEFAIDGNIDPLDPAIRDLNGLKYYQLSDEVRDEFDTFSIRIFSLTDYSPEEPHELFFRLNQPTSLTEAEKRNAFIGGPRNQVKELVEWAIQRGMTGTKLGFTNARMAYDDLLARFLLTVEQRVLFEKITAARITERYRNADRFSREVMDTAQDSLSFLLGIPFLEGGIKPNKATIHTWLCMAARAQMRGGLADLTPGLEQTIHWIESNRMQSRASVRDEDRARIALAIFHDRATSRVADVASVILRDITAWMLAEHLGGLKRDEVGLLTDSRSAWLEFGHDTGERGLLDYAMESGWGAL